MIGVSKERDVLSNNRRKENVFSNNNSKQRCDEHWYVNYVAGHHVRYDVFLNDPSAEEGAEILDKVIALNPEKGMVSPYMNHHFVEALLKCGKKEQAMDYMKYYWGGMLSHGADTFWELYNPENPAESPYGGSIVNSYCHAWSCTPTYLLRKYFI